MRRVVLVYLGIVAGLTFTAGSARAEEATKVEEFPPRARAGDLVLAPGFGLECADRAPVPLAIGPRTIYANFDGVTLTRVTDPSQEDATQNKSYIVNSSSESIPAFDHTDIYSYGMSRQEVISGIVSYMNTAFNPYDVTVTTSRPSSGAYTMVVFGGTAQAVLGESGGTLGVSLWDCGDYLSSQVVFAFTGESYFGDMDVQHTSQVGIHELGHSYGLQHIQPSSAIMHYQVGPSTSVATTFNSTTQNIYDPYYPNATNCSGGSTQNSHQVLLSTIGPRGQDVSPPNVTITTPLDGSNAYQGDPIRATATDASGIDYVEVQIAGVTIGTDNSPPYEWTIPFDSPIGDQPIRVRAYDTNGQSGFDQVLVTINSGEAPPCHNNDDCDPGEICDEQGDCVPEYVAGDLGAPCYNDDSCNDPYFCAVVGDAQRCSVGCDAANPCPEGFDCIGACWPAATDDGDDDGGGGCFGSVSDTTATRAPLAPLLLLAFGLLVVFRRRK